MSFNIKTYEVNINGKSFKFKPQDFLALMAKNPGAKKVS